MRTRPDFEVDGRTVLIPGGSSGIGLEAGRQLADRGANIIIIACNIDSLNFGIDYISQGARSPSTQRFDYVKADLRDAAECERAVAEATNLNFGSPPDVVWCCQGSSRSKLFVDTPVEKFQEMMDQDYFSCVYIAHAMLNRWLRPDSAGMLDSKAKPQSSRHLIFTSSFVLLPTSRGYSPYSPSKLALRSLGQSLAQQTQIYAISDPDLPQVYTHIVYLATTCIPSPGPKKMMENDISKMLEDADAGETPAESAAESIKGLEKGMEVVTTSWLTWLVWCGQKETTLEGGLWESLFQWVTGHFVGLMLIGVKWHFDRKLKARGSKSSDNGAAKESTK